jgi:iron(III) transport system substrate-binding protein
LDDIFSRPVKDAFEKKTGIRVNFQTDVEATKTVGLVTRLIRRKKHPEADVFWNNEWAQTLVLKNEGVLAPYKPENAEGLPASVRDPEGWWTGFAARARVILYNTELVKADEVPKRVADLADPRYKGRVAIARPLSGTTFTHAAILFSRWGEEKARAYFKALKENNVKIASGNAHARNLVQDGEIAICLTDTDDANGAFIKGRPVEMVYPDQGADGDGTVVIPNTVAMIKGGPNPENAKKLIEFLVSAEVEAMLARGESVQMPLRPGVSPPSGRFRLDRIKIMEIDWADAATKFQAVKSFVQQELMW